MKIYVRTLFVFIPALLCVGVSVLTVQTPAYLIRTKTSIDEYTVFYITRGVQLARERWKAGVVQPMNVLRCVAYVIQDLTTLLSYWHVQIFY